MLGKYQKHIIATFLKKFFIVSFFFFSLTLILNIIEEIKFFKNSNVEIYFPIFLTIINTPSILFEIFPFILLISTIFFFIEILDKNELNIYKINGLSNTKVIFILFSTTFLIGVFLIFIFYNFSATLKFIYFDIKNDYSKDDKYLAVITENGLWIKDQDQENINIINAARIEGENLIGVIITQFDEDYNFKRLIKSSKVNIREKIWQIKGAYVTENNTTKIAKDIILFKSSFNADRIQNYFSNLSALNLFELQNLKENYDSIGYSTVKIKAHLNKIYSYPLYLVNMVLISTILMLNIKNNQPRLFYFIIGIAISVLIYYFNYLFNLLVENGQIHYMISIWLVQFIILLITSLGLIKINEK